MAEMQSAIAAAQKVHASPIEAMSELEREMEVRTRIYDKWVREQKMSWADARDRYARMTKALLLVRRVVEAETATEEPFTPEVVNG